MLAALGLSEARLDEQLLRETGSGRAHWAVVELALPGRGACFGAARAPQAEQALVQALLSAARRLQAG